MFIHMHQVASTLIVIVIVVACESGLSFLVLFYLSFGFGKLILYFLFLGWTHTNLRLPKSIFNMALWLKGRSVLCFDCRRHVMVEWLDWRDIVFTILLDIGGTMWLTVYVEISIRLLNDE